MKQVQTAEVQTMEMVQIAEAQIVEIQTAEAQTVEAQTVEVIQAAQKKKRLLIQLHLHMEEILLPLRP